MSPEVHKNKVISVGNYVFTGNTLGKGNFARVEEAIHTILNVKVAIKIIDINHIKEDYVVKNLYREAKIMSKLNHPCIVSLFQTMQRSDNVYYIVTEIANGGDLCAFVKKHVSGKLGEKQTRIYAKQFSSALCHMHNFRVVHRDLKMENVMLNSIQTQIKIVDFGLSNFWNADNPLRTHCGSPEYAAPELFVTGKKYGTEVDLWSFGIILYGMVLGQLPFVTSRSQELASQERRKQLVAQINKGLSTVHRRALSSFTPEFRSLMNRLLVADSTRRITTVELVVHPWITEKGKTMICPNPLKILDSIEKNKIVAKISTVLQVEPKIVSSTILQDSLGKVGGMFNILKRHYQLSLIKGDGSSKAMPSLTIFDLANLSNSLEKKSSLSSSQDQKLTFLQSAFQKPHTAQTQTKKSDYLRKVLITDGKRPKQSIILAVDEQVKLKSAQLKKKSVQQHNVRPNTVQDVFNQEKIYKLREYSRPCTVQPVIEQKSAPVDYRSIKSPSLRRKVYSATITNKANSPTVKIADKKPSSTKPNEEEISFMKPLENIDFSRGKYVSKNTLCEKYAKTKAILFKEKLKEIKFKESLHTIKEKEATSKTPVEHKRTSNIRNYRRQLLEMSNDIIKTSTFSKNRMLPSAINKDTYLRPPESSPENNRSKSEQTTRRRPTTGPLHQILEKSLKTIGIVAHASSSKSSKNYQKTSDAISSSKEKKDKKDETWELSHMAFGDFAARASTSHSHNRKLAIYDPIAKSIADYVSNNVSNKIYHYPWLKK